MYKLIFINLLISSFSTQYVISESKTIFENCVISADSTIEDHMNEFKRRTNAKLKDMDYRIKVANAKIKKNSKKEGNKFDAETKKTIKKLEATKVSIRKKLDLANKESQKDWENFKKEVNREFEEFAKDVNNFGKE